MPFFKGTPRATSAGKNLSRRTWNKNQPNICRKILPSHRLARVLLKMFGRLDQWMVDRWLGRDLMNGKASAHLIHAEADEPLDLFVVMSHSW